MRGVTSVRSGRLGAAGLTLLALLAAGCSGSRDSPRALPPGVADPSFVVQSFDAQGTLLLGAPSGVYRSTDGGQSWTPTSPPIFRGLSAGFSKASTLVTRGVLVQRGNLSLDHVNLPQRSPFGTAPLVALAWIPGGKLYAAVRGASLPLYVSTNSAQSWYGRPALGLPDGVQALAAARVPGQSDVVYAAAGRGGLWRSTDAGVSWHRVPGAGGVVTSVSTTPARWPFVVVAGRTVRWSGDYGATWHDSGYRARLVACDPRNERVVFAVTSERPPRLAVSTDGARSW
jgi:hypothetical protein